MAHTADHICNFDKIRLKPWTLYVNKDFPGISMAPLLPLSEQLDGVRGPFIEVRSSRFARVFKCSVGFAGRCHNLYLKQYLYRSIWDFIKHLFRDSRAKRAFTASLTLAEKGFCAPQVIAAGQRKYGPFCTANFLITRALDDARDIYTCFDNNWLKQSPDVLRDKRRFIKALGETIGRMHSAGIFHGDMRAGNVFAKKSGRNWQFFFLDNERTKRFRRLPQRLRLKNLVQINMLLAKSITNTDRMRFFDSYIEQDTSIKHKYKNLAEKIIARTRKRLGLPPPAGGF
ncbi:MAG: lipopolysaccharide kinase InaA family protein [Planctomycetota bacterium]|jgi:tRNA A-37 threonylcarbamoyl transferase component Bud32